MSDQWLAGCQGQGLGPHHGEAMVAHVLATKGGLGIGLSEFGEQAGGKASIMLTGKQAKRFMAALAKAMTRAGLTQRD